MRSSVGQEAHRIGNPNAAKGVAEMTPRMINVEIYYALTALCGATLLIMLDKWRRRRGRKDLNFVWLYISLLSWAAASGLQLLNLAYPLDNVGFSSAMLIYFLSPISTVLFSLTAFRLIRIKELFPGPDVEYWPKVYVCTVALISAAAWLLQWFGHPGVASFLDAGASSLAVIALGMGLIYTFNKSGHQLLVGLTGIVFLLFVARQFYVAFEGPPSAGWLVIVFLADYTMLVMLLVALAMSWGRVEVLGGRFTHISSSVNVAVMVIDLRGSTRWTIRAAERDFRHVKTFIDDLRAWVMCAVEASGLGRPHYVKYVGDGWVLVWEIPDVSRVDSVNAGVKLAHYLSSHYHQWIKKNKNKFWCGGPDGIGIGFDVGPALRLILDDSSEDYLGYPMSLAAKMQHQARPCGVVIQAKSWELLNGLRGRFPRQAVMKFGAEEVPIRMTDDVRAIDATDGDERQEN